MNSWSGIGVPTTRAIIRESARLVNLTLGRAGFFICSAGSYAEGDLWNRMASPSEYVPRYPEVKGRGGFSDENLHPYALDFWIFWAIPSTPTEQETCVSRPVVSASIPQKPLSLAFQIP